MSPITGGSIVVYGRSLSRFQATLRALGRHWRRPRVPAAIEVLIVSPGGVATTMLIKHIGRFRVTNHPGDRDRLKHRSRPPRLTNPTTKTVFLTGDPEECFNSLERRGWIGRNAVKLGAPAVLWRGGEARKKAFLTAVERQKRAWRRHRGPLMMVDYEDLWDRIGDIAAFLEIDDERFVEEFPARRPRGEG